MPIAIHTKYIGPANTLGARVKASVYRGYKEGKPIIWSVTVPYDHSADDRHVSAAIALVKKYWPEAAPIVDYVGATLDGNGDVFSFEPR